MLRILLFSLMLVSGVSAQTTTVEQTPGLQAAIEPPAPTMFPIEEVVPLYPLKAARDRVGGFVMVKFNVSAEGEVKDPVVSFSQPVGIFEDAALAAALKMRYRPQVRKGKPINVDGVQHFFTFDPDKAFEIPKSD